MLGMFGGCFVNGVLCGFVQCGMGCIVSDGGYDGDFQKKVEVIFVWGRNFSGWMKNIVDVVFVIMQVVVWFGGFIFVF